ncbi:hypothetical protein AB0952_03730 [Streptomyces caniferus]|uniref:hypothetical protein n=1 Tax=Streptomyces caniferus TaxID=285557 RepID=UPI003456F8FE
MGAAGRDADHPRTTPVDGLSSLRAQHPGPIAALIAVGITVALIPVGHLLLANRLNLSPQSTAILTRFGGLFVVTIGIQLVLGGIKTYFGIE